MAALNERIVARSPKNICIHFASIQRCLGRKSDIEIPCIPISAICYQSASAHQNDPHQYNMNLSASGDTSKSIPLNNNDDEDDGDITPRSNKTDGRHCDTSILHSRKLTHSYENALSHRLAIPTLPLTAHTHGQKPPSHRLAKPATYLTPLAHYSLTTTHRRRIVSITQTSPSPTHRQTAPSTSPSPYSRKRPEAPSRRAYISTRRL